MRKHDLMYVRFGHDITHKCSECENFVFIRPTDRRHSKCEVYGITNSEATDWNGRKMACGHFNIPLDNKEITVIEEKKHARLVYDAQCAGQVRFF